MSRKDVFLIFLAISFAFLEMRSLAEEADKDFDEGSTKVIYPKRTEFNFEGLELEGELRNPGEFYFQARPREAFDSLVKRRPNFHQQMMRDVAMSR